ncbi:MAG: phosphatidylserine decarboxylase family protein [Bacteroidales bacterium]|jgi:phosphatidylserine decarboxylase|nr:phosphatidylserine decarboxylase family protein [Bacteroidales bacterium]
MRIHPAGKNIVSTATLILGTIALISIMVIPYKLFWLTFLVLFCLLIIGIWIVSFFRYPQRSIENPKDNHLYSAADGEVVVIEKIKSNLFPENEAYQISVFMSIYSVHINYVPINGTISSVTHRKGLHLMAIKPKASLENEQCETIINTKNQKKVIVRQIAGAAARRVLTFVKPEQEVIAGNELGFIRFGSRVDIIFPVNSEINVKIGDKVKGCKTILATIN